MTLTGKRLRNHIEYDLGDGFTVTIKRQGRYKLWEAIVHKQGQNIKYLGAAKSEKAAVDVFENYYYRHIATGNVKLQNYYDAYVKWLDTGEFTKTDEFTN